MAEDDPRDSSLNAARDAIEFGPPDFEIRTADEVDHYLDYLLSLMGGSEALFTTGHYHLAAFAAITAIEETARAHLSIFRGSDAARKKGRDPLRNHAEKQKAAMGVIFMGQRMHDILGGEDAAQDFHRKINSGYFNELREKSLYCFPGDVSFVRPTDFIDIDMARIVVLVAIETVDDTFCGLTNHSFQVSKEFDAIFDRIRAHEP